MMEAGKLLSSLLHGHSALGTSFWTHHFSVSLLLDELANVPRVTGWLFCKVRMLDGSYSGTSPRQEVQDNTVQWGKLFKFECWTSVNSSTGVLQNCLCRISIREDQLGGTSFRKVGYVDINLSELAGSGRVTRNYLLEGYTKDNKLDNSIMKIDIQIQLLQGDPCFRVPSQQSLRTRTMSTRPCHEHMISSDSELGSSEDVLQVTSGQLQDTLPDQTAEAQERGLTLGHLTRVRLTRVDAREVVEKLCLESLASASEFSPPIEDSGLSLIVGHDGSTSLGVIHTQNRESDVEDLDNVIIMK